MISFSHSDFLFLSTTRELLRYSGAVVPLLEKVLKALKLPFFKPEECRYFHDVVVQAIRCEIEQKKSLFFMTFSRTHSGIIRALKYFCLDDQTS